MNIKKRMAAFALTGMLMAGACLPTAFAVNEGNGADKDGISDVGPARSYTVLADELQNTTPSWKLSRVYNTKSGILIRYPSVSASDSFRVIHGKRILSESSQYLDMDSWFDTVDKPYGLLRADGTEQRYLDIDCKNGQAYQYKVIYQYANGVIAASDEVVMYRLRQPTITAVSNKKNAMTVSWKRNSKASGYQLRYAVKSKSSKWKYKTAEGKNTTRKTLSGYKQGKQYRVAVRSYKTVDGKKYYSAWSDTTLRYVKK